MSVWLLLRYFRRKTSAERVIRLCRHTKLHGTFTVALAVALHEHRLAVSFHTDVDPHPKPLERKLYNAAKKRGIAPGEALGIEQLLDRVRAGETAIVGFETDEGNGHFTPLIGVKRRWLILPYTDRGGMSISQFEKRWSAPGICRQCVLVSRHP